MVKNGKLECANFICRFGEDKVLLDLAREIVIPAFISTQLKRETGTATYFFHDIQVLDLGSNDIPIIAIAGRFVKDMTLSREQVYDKESRILIPSRSQMRSAPSSLFVLILNNHKLLYLRETSGGPGLISFETTIKHFIKRKHEEFIAHLYAINSSQESSTTERELLEQYPKPTVDVVPLAGGNTLEEFIGRFDVLESIRIRLLATNNEIDNNNFFELFRKNSDELGSKKTTLEYENKEGLLKNQAISALNAASKQGNSKISFIGKDSEGEILKGDNNRFKIYIPVKDVSSNISEMARQLFNNFQRQVDFGVIYNGGNEDDITEEMRRLQEYVNRRDEETQ